MCTFDRAGCKDGSVLAAGGAAIRGSSGRSSEYYDAGGAVGVAAAAFLRMSLLPQAALVHMGRLGIILVLL